MSAVVHARVVEHLQRLRLGFVAERLHAVLTETARREPTYLDFLDQVLRQEVEAKQRKRIAMGVQIAHFPSVKTLEAFEFKFQPSVDQRLVRELATGRFISAAENVLIFGAPGVGKTHLAIARVGSASSQPDRYTRPHGLGDVGSSWLGLLAAELERSGSTTAVRDGSCQTSNSRPMGGFGTGRSVHWVRGS